MKTKTKRLSALFMAFAMSVSVLQATAFAAGGDVVNPPETPAPLQGCVGHELSLESDISIDKDGKFTYKVWCDTDQKEYTVTGTADVIKRTEANCTTPAMVTYMATAFDGSTVTQTYSAAKALGHNYNYTFTWPEHKYLTDGNKKLEVKVTGTCTDCGHKVTDTVEAVQQGAAIFDKATPCKAGSVTFGASYTESKDSENRSAVTTATDTKTYAYYPEFKAHTIGEPQIENIIDPTCLKNGSYDHVIHCTVCGEVLYTRTELLGKTDGHTASPAVKENVVKATYAKGGSYDLVTRCADCGKVLDKVHKTTAKLTVNAPVLSSVKNVKGKKATVAWKKASSVSGYQVQYATSSSFKSAKSVKTTASSKTISKLSKNKKYYVRVRSYKVVSGKTYYSSWSKVKTVTIKK